MEISRSLVMMKAPWNEGTSYDTFPISVDASEGIFSTSLMFRFNVPISSEYVLHSVGFARMSLYGISLSRDISISKSAGSEVLVI